MTIDSRTSSSTSAPGQPGRATHEDHESPGGSSLGSVVAMPELLYQARQAQSLTYNATPIVVAAIIYFVMLWPVVRLQSRLENRALAAR